MNVNTEKAEELHIRKRSLINRLLMTPVEQKGVETAPTLEMLERIELMEGLKDAKEEWIHAQVNFEYAQEQEMIDYYTYKIKACEVRYQYFLRKAKEMGAF